IALRSNTPFAPRALETIERERNAGRVVTVSNGVEIATMVRPDAPRPLTKMVELRAVDASYPLYGTLTLREGTYSYEMLRGRGAVVRPELLAQLGLRIGDRIFIGSQPFEIRGVIASEPGRNLGAFSLGSRVIVDHADPADTGLLSFRTRALHLMLLRVPPQATQSVLSA